MLSHGETAPAEAPAVACGDQQGRRGQEVEAGRREDDKRDGGVAGTALDKGRPRIARLRDQREEGEGERGTERGACGLQSVGTSIERPWSEDSEFWFF